MVLSPPQAAGTVDVRVTNAGGTSPLVPADQFQYQAPAPTIISVDPTGGPTPGGTHVTITGADFTGAFDVLFGEFSSSFTVVSDRQITAAAPAQAAGSVDIVVITPAGSSTLVPGDQYQYVPAPPTVLSLTPPQGTARGGTAVNIGGTNYANATSVAFGGVSANFSVVDATHINAFSPPGTAGQAVPVVVSNSDGQSNANVQFTYQVGTPAPEQEMAEEPAAAREIGGAGNLAANTRRRARR
jgi:hypothetical protein